MTTERNPTNKAVDNAFLQKAFMLLNRRFFNNRIPGSIQVKFMKNCGHRDEDGKWKSAVAMFIKNADAIAVDYGMRFFPDYIVICLLHEMVHIDLRFQGYVGWERDEGHGTRFQGGILELFKKGAYDGIL